MTDTQEDLKPTMPEEIWACRSGSVDVGGWCATKLDTHLCRAKYIRADLARPTEPLPEDRQRALAVFMQAAVCDQEFFFHNKDGVATIKSALTAPAADVKRLKKEVHLPDLPTEELAELSAIIQAIEWERENDQPTGST